METSVLLNGYHGAFKYNKTFIEILNQNIAKGKHNIYSSKEEANFSLSRNKFSVLKYIDDDFKINDVYEFIIYYKELDIIIHWNQTKTIHELNNDVGYMPIHVDSNIAYFRGLAVNEKSYGSYLDGMPSSGDWWYCIGATQTHSENGRTGMPGPKIPSKIEVNVTSLWIRVDSFDILKKLPSIVKKLTCKCKTCNSHNYISFVIIIIS